MSDINNIIVDSIKVHAKDFPQLNRDAAIVDAIKLSLTNRVSCVIELTCGNTYYRIDGHELIDHVIGMGKPIERTDNVSHR